MKWIIELDIPEKIGNGIKTGEYDASEISQQLDEIVSAEGDMFIYNKEVDDGAIDYFGIDVVDVRYLNESHNDLS